ncbi:uncharacterized protein LOC135843044 [Planococcus citri]|uniref:uncharacterized protein LOC135843044 n=1 Tax=Planococcus citri TaxID=170843 RepID=UPI0031F933A3
MNERHLKFHTNPPSLSELASITAAIDFCRHEVSVRWASGSISQVCQLFMAFPGKHIPSLPRRIRELIRCHIELVQREIETWINYQCDRIFESRSMKAAEFLIEFFDRITWFQPGIIDYERTAENMLECGRLTELEKYSVACTYCFEEDVLKLRELLKEGICRPNIIFIQHSLLYYWEYRLIDKIPVIPNNIPDFLDTSIMNWPAVDNWPAIRYFFNYLDDLNQTFQAKQIIARYIDGKFTPFILAELTEAQFEHVVAEMGSVMMLRMINNPKLNDYTFQIWLQVRHVMNQSQFFEMIRGILNSRIRYSGNLTNEETVLRIRIWSTANGVQKETAISGLIEERTPFEYRGCLKRLPRDQRFLLNILADASFEQRNFIWRHNWLSLIYGTNVHSLEQLMGLCLKNAEEVVMFKEQVLMNFSNIEKYCLELAEERLFDELNEFLRFCCSPHPEQVPHFKKQILESCFLGENSKINYHLLRDLHQLDKFIGETFQDDNLAANFKKQMVVLPTNVEFIQSVVLNGDLRLVKNLFSLFLSTEPDLKWMKCQFLDLCRSSLSSDNFTKFETREWQDFIGWCAGNEQKVKEFKRSIRLDDVFETVLTRCFEFQSITHCCSATKCDNDMSFYNLLNNFLLWYFGCVEEINRFKLNKIGRYDEIRILTRIFAEGSECFIDSLLQWFFNSDNEAIEKFKTTFKKSRNSFYY